MTVLREGNLTFEFVNAVAVVKYDEWQPFLDWRDAVEGRKGVDFVAIEGRSAWFIEVKDFRVQDGPPQSANSSKLAETVLAKVESTLAGLADIAIARIPFAERAVGANRNRVVLHLEPPIHGQRLFPSQTQAVNILQRMKQLFREGGSEPLVLRIATTTPDAGVPWTVS